MENIYYHPEFYGLEIAYEVDVAGSYEFDKLVIWRRKDGSLLCATDSGCSCPVPFENLVVEDLQPAVQDEIREWFISRSTSSSNYKVGELEKALAILQVQQIPTEDEMKRADSWKTHKDLNGFVSDQLREDDP